MQKFWSLQFLQILFPQTLKTVLINISPDYFSWFFLGFGSFFPLVFNPVPEHGAYFAVCVLKLKKKGSKWTTNDEMSELKKERSSHMFKIWERFDSEPEGCIMFGSVL